jgi:hypothetical protein
MSFLIHYHILLIGIKIKLQSGANDARSDDTSKLKTAIADWLNAREPSDIVPTRLSSRGKEERGICNDVTGRLLCPIDYDWDNPQYVTHHLFPSRSSS